LFPTLFRTYFNGTLFVKGLSNTNAMFRYFAVLFFRNLKRQKLFSIINILGLTAGIVSTIMIYLYVKNERSYDRFHANAENIYRINQTFIWGENDDNQFASLGPGAATALKAELGEAKEVTRLHPPGNFLITYQDKNDIRAFDEDRILAADSNFFSVFTFPLLKGNPSTALTHPNTVVLTASTAKKYFGDTDPMGKLMSFEEKGQKNTFEVTGIVQDTPENSYIEFDFLISMMSIPRIQYSNDLWLWTTFETFVLMDEKASITDMEKRVLNMPRQYAAETLKQGMNQTFEEYEASGKKWELFVQPLTAIRLHSSNIYNRLNEVGNIMTVNVLIGVEIFIILLSCINFMNLSTAQYTRRVKESSIRKVLGSNKLQLSLHFFAEAFMYCLISAAFAVGIVQLLLPVFNFMSGVQLSFDVFQNPQLLGLLLALVFVMSIVSGSYPALFLSRFSAVETMKGKLKTGKSGQAIRNSLVIFQFVISTVIIVFTIVVFDQIRFLGNKNIGFSRENLLVISNAEWAANGESFTNQVANIPGVLQVSYSTSVPPNLYDGDQFGVVGSEKYIPLNYTKADENYIPTLELKILFGRNFSKETLADSGRVILNETAVASFGWTLDENVLGKKLSHHSQQYEVIGVIKDFNYWALEAPIQPMGIFHTNATRLFSIDKRFVAIRTASKENADLPGLVKATQKQWEKFAGTYPFRYSFVDDDFAATYLSEERFGNVLSVFAGLAILIASLGLLGMIIYNLEQRTKEIGIRKVVGASSMNIWSLIVKNYLYLMGAAFVLSIPCCWMLLNSWLENFNHRIEITIWPFLIAMGCILITAIAITAYHVGRAAQMNPVNVLKDE
jgi:putative ABC transport system permease protein